MCTSCVRFLTWSDIGWLGRFLGETCTNALGVSICVNADARYSASDQAVGRVELTPTLEVGLLASFRLGGTGWRQFAYLAV